MIRTLAVLLLIVAFLAGYYVGRLPGSPDVFAWARETYQKASEYGSKGANVIDETRNCMRPVAGTDGGTIVEIGGKLYRIGENSSQR